MALAVLKEEGAKRKAALSVLQSQEHQVPRATTTSSSASSSVTTAQPGKRPLPVGMIPKEKKKKLATEIR